MALVSALSVFTTQELLFIITSRLMFLFDGQHREILTLHELAFLLLRVQVVAQVEDDWKEEHEAGHSNDWHVLLVFQ